jgi:hypothetical protein
MGLRGWLRRLVLGTGKQSAGETRQAAVAGKPAEQAAAGQPAHEVTAQFLWSTPWGSDYPEWDCGRALYTTDPAHAHDLQFLGRLLTRINDLWQRGTAETAVEAAVLARVVAPYERDQRAEVPAEFCGSDGVVLHDLAWRRDDLGPDFEAGDLNRSLRKLTLTGDRPVIHPASANEADRRARERMRALQVRGAIPLTALRVQANGALYEPGTWDAPGVVLFSLSPGADLEQLDALADDLFEARIAPDDPPPDIAEAVGLMRANVGHWIYHRRAPVRPSRVGGQEVHVADLWFHRLFLRDGSIKRERGRALPCLVEPGPQGGIELLPWDEEFGPFVEVDPAWLRWNDRCVVRIARGIAEARTFEELPILADALEEAGCTSPEVLNHCRQPGEHLRNCWVIQRLLDEAETDSRPG